MKTGRFISLWRNIHIGDLVKARWSRGKFFRINLRKELSEEDRKKVTKKEEIKITVLKIQWYPQENSFSGVFCSLPGTCNLDYLILYLHIILVHQYKGVTDTTCSLYSETINYEKCPFIFIPLKFFKNMTHAYSHFRFVVFPTHYYWYEHHYCNIMNLCPPCV